MEPGAEKSVSGLLEPLDVVKETKKVLYFARIERAEGARGRSYSNEPFRSRGPVERYGKTVAAATMTMAVAEKKRFAWLVFHSRNMAGRSPGNAHTRLVNDHLWRAVRKADIASEAATAI